MRSGSPENQAAELHLGSGHGPKATRSGPDLVALELPTAQVACYKLQNLSSSEQLQSDEIGARSRRFGAAQGQGGLLQNRPLGGQHQSDEIGTRSRRFGAAKSPGGLL